MIFEWLFQVVAGAVELVVGLFPTGDAPGEQIDLVVHGYAWFDSFLPVSEALDVFILALEVLLVLGGLRVTVWTLTKLHVLGGS